MATYNGVPSRTITLPQSKYAIKATYPMVAKGATAHNTYNDATAYNEIKYMQNNNNYVSYHAAIDDKEVVWGVPLNRSTWHAGDGSNGYGNRNHVSFEICYSKNGGEKYRKAEANAVKVIAYFLYEKKWNVSKLKKHQDWSGKYCPHRILSEGRWNQFINKVSAELNRLNNKSNTTEKEIDIMSQPFKPTSPAISQSVQDVIYSQSKKEWKKGVPYVSDEWRKKFNAGDMTLSDAIGLVYVMIDRGAIELGNKDAARLK